MTIEFAHIVPTAALPMLCNGRKIQMALTHKVLDREDPNYAAYYKNVDESSYVILDNSLWELGASLDVGDLFYACELIEPDELIIPDVFRDGKETIRSYEKFWDNSIQAFRDRFPNLKFNVVVQGSDLTEWLECYDYMAAQPSIDTLSIPKVLDKDLGIGGRISILDLLTSTERISTKNYHLLGLWDNPIELLTIADRHPWIRSADSALPVHAALSGIRFNLIDGYVKQPGVKRPENYFELSYSEVIQHLRSILWNMRTTRVWCKGGNR